MDRNMKKFVIAVLIILAMVVIGYFGFRFFRARQQTNTINSLQTVTSNRGSLTATVGATGTVRADQTAMLSWQTSGIVDNVYVQVGQVITSGQTLADLEQSSLPQNIILAESDLITARNSVANLTNPDLSTISNSERALATAYTNFQQAQNDLTNAIITNQNANDLNLYSDWLNKKTALDIALNNLPLANSSLDVQAYYQAVRTTSQLQDELKLAQSNASTHQEDVQLSQKAADLQIAVQNSLDRQNKIQAGLSSSTTDLVKSLSDGLSAYEASTKEFIGTVLTDTLNTSVDLAQVQADLAQKQSDLINTESKLDSLVNQRNGMNGERCDADTIADYQKAYDSALNAYNFTGHIPNSSEYKLLQTATANLNWCTAVWSDADIAAQDAKIASTQAQIRLLQAQITADQTQITDATNSVYGLAIYLTTSGQPIRCRSVLNKAVTTLYGFERTQPRRF
jgi:multidrug efflux pump subunit AcrA (membrane-fusion protein)